MPFRREKSIGEYDSQSQHWQVSNTMKTLSFHYLGQIYYGHFQKLKCNNLKKNPYMCVSKYRFFHIQYALKWIYECPSCWEHCATWSNGQECRIKHNIGCRFSSIGFHNNQIIFQFFLPFEHNDLDSKITFNSFHYLFCVVLGQL
jgi:hypothetical protein